MPYTPTAFTSGGAPGIDSGVLNAMQTQYTEATSSYGPDEVAPFVLSGAICTIHGGLPKQMDVTTCVYYPKQTDNTMRRQSVTATNFTTVTASTTYFLDYNPDGTTSWGTSHSGVANFMPIVSVTTDGSGNINVITDARPTLVNQFPTAVGIPQFGGVTLLRIKSAGGGAAGTTVWVGTTDPGSNAAEGDLWIKG